MATLAPRADAAPMEISFWQKPFVQDILPFITSVVVHLSFIALGMLTYKAVTTIVYATREISVVPEPTAIPHDLPAAPLGRIGYDDGTDDMAGRVHNLAMPPDVDGLGTKPSTGLARALSDPGGGDGNADNMIAVGPGAGTFGKGGKGVGIGTGDGSGTSDGEMGLAPRSDRDKRPWGTTVFRGAYCTRVVFLCDASGSMMNKFDTLRVEIRKALDLLRPIQSFDVIFFNSDTHQALDPQLLLALPETKRRAYEFLDRSSPTGSSDPTSGLRAAFAARPQLIFFLTDGDFPNSAQVVEEIRRLNPANPQTGRRPVMINTIAFLDRGEEYEKILQQIARENGGLFKFVSDADLGR